MKISIKFFGTIKEALGIEKDTIEIEPDSTIKDIIEIIIKKYDLPRKEEIMGNDPFSNIVPIINGTSAFALNGLKTELHEGDEVIFIPAYTGG